MQALGKYVLIKPEKRKEKTDLGVFQADAPQNNDKPPRGTVVSVGYMAFREMSNDGDLMGTQVKEGAIVHFKKYAVMNELGEGDDALLAVEDTDVIAVVQTP